MSKEDPHPRKQNIFNSGDVVKYKGKEYYITHFYLTDDYLGYAYEIVATDKSEMHPEVFEEELVQENKGEKEMNVTTFSQDIFNAISMKKPWYVYLLQFFTSVAFAFMCSLAFGSGAALVLTICICLILFPLMDYFFYLTNINNCLDKIDNHVDKVEESFTDNQFFKDKDGILYNVYKLYFRCRDDDFRFCMLEYGKTEEELWNFWLNNEEVHKHYSLFKVELIKKRRPEEKKDE